ncbi:MAG: hypothetical protein V1928_04250 [Parcubacteria group bacterium]
MDTWIIVLICVGLFLIALGLLYVSATLVKTPEGHVSIISDRALGPIKIVGPVYNFKRIWPFELVAAVVDMTQHTDDIPHIKVPVLKFLPAVGAVAVIVYLSTSEETSLAWKLDFNGIGHKQAILELIKDYFNINQVMTELSGAHAYEKKPNPITDDDLQNFLSAKTLILPSGNFDLDSFQAQCDSTDKEKLKNYFQLLENNKLDEKKIFEMLKDVAQNALREKVASLTLNEVLKDQHSIIKQVKEKLILNIEKISLPVKAIDLTMQDPMEILDKDLKKAVESQAIIETKKEAAKDQKELDILEANAQTELDLIKAKKAIQLAKLDAEQQQITLDALKKNYGIDDLKGKGKIAEHFLQREALKVLGSPNKIYFLNGGESALAQIIATAQSISETGGKKS